MSQITKNALAASLKRLLSKKELSKITITNITEECGVNRQTFYYHFKDIYDLLEWIFTNEVIEEIDNEKEEDWQQKFIYIFEYVIKNKEFIKNIYNSGSKEYFLKFVYKQTNLLIINFIEKEYKNKKVKEENKKFIANFYKYGFVGIMFEWIQAGMKEDIEELVNKMSLTLHNTVTTSLHNFQQDNAKDKQEK